MSGPPRRRLRQQHPQRGQQTNQLIFNLKKSPDRRGRAEWRYKEQAIRDVARALRAAIKQEYLDTITFVPIPPSKVKADPLYDDRMTRVLEAIRPEPPLDIRELIAQTASTQAAHEGEHRPSPSEMETRYAVDVVLAYPPHIIFIVDDMLTTGAHFRAAKSLLTSQFPELQWWAFSWHAASYPNVVRTPLILLHGLPPATVSWRRCFERPRLLLFLLLLRG